MTLLDRVQEWIIKARTGEMDIKEVVEKLYVTLLRRVPEIKVETMLQCIIDIMYPKIDRYPLKPLNILLQFRETEYVSRSKQLRISFETVFAVQKDLSEYQAITCSLRDSDWKKVDELLQGAWNTTEHFVILFPLFFKMYYASKEITLTQFQTVLAIQQMRWAYSKDNPYNDVTKQFFEISLADIKSTGRMIFNVGYFQNRDNVYYKIRVLPRGKTGQRRFFYVVGGDKSEDNIFPIPETFKRVFLEQKSHYSPRLVIGSLKSSSLVRFMFKYKERPFLCHHPLVSAAQNTLVFDQYPGEAIFVHWLHDYFHTIGFDKNAPLSIEILRDLKKKLQEVTSQISQQQCMLFTDTGSHFPS